MRVYFDEEVKCPHCGHEEVAWQVTRESTIIYSKNVPVARVPESRLIIDTICQNPDCKEYGRVTRAYKGLEVL